MHFYIRAKTMAAGLCAYQFDSSTSPPPGIWTFKDWLGQIPSPVGKKSRSNAPPISTELPLLKDKFRLQSNTLHAFQREICRNYTFKLLLKTLLKELFTNKGEILSCKSVKPCKNRKKLMQGLSPYEANRGTCLGHFFFSFSQSFYSFNTLNT